MLPTSTLAPLTGAPREPEIAVDLHGNGPPSRDLLQALRPGRLIVFARPGDAVPPGAEVSVWDDDEHEVARWCRLLREHLAGVGEPPAVWSLAAGTAARAPRCHRRAPGRRRRIAALAVERWAAVAAALSADGHRLVVTGTPGEQGIVDAVARPAGAQTETCLDVDELFGLIAAARMVLSGDTGVAHVASAFGSPSVVLFGPVSPARWGPPARARHQALWPAPIPATGETRTEASPTLCCSASPWPTSSPPRSGRSRRAGRTEPTWARSPRAAPGWSVPVRRDRGESE